MTMPKTFGTELLKSADLNGNFQYLDKISAKGDMIYGDANGHPATLPIGSEEKILQISNGLPVWAAKETLTDSITAHSGGGQTNATQLSIGLNRITNCAANGDSVKLPSNFIATNEIIIINDGAYACDIFPASGDYINNLAINTAFRLPAGDRIVLRATADNSNWSIISLYGNIIWDEMTAYAGGGQANATALSLGFSIITTAATTNDSVKLPPTFAVGDFCIVRNEGAKTINIYPSSGDNLGLGVDTPIPLIPKNSLVFRGRTANSVWACMQDSWQMSDTVGPTVTASVAGWSTIMHSSVVSYKNGIWRAKGNVVGSVNSGSRDNNIITIANYVFNATSSAYQDVDAYSDGGVYKLKSYAISNTSTMQHVHGTGTTTRYGFTYDVELKQQPTDI